MKKENSRSDHIRCIEKNSLISMTYNAYAIIKSDIKQSRFLKAGSILVVKEFEISMVYYDIIIIKVHCRLIVSNDSNNSAFTTCLNDDLLLELILPKDTVNQQKSDNKKLVFTRNFTKEDTLPFSVIT